MREQARLSAAKVRTISEPGQFSDGNGSTLRVEPSGSKRWYQRVTIHGKRRNIGLGGYPAVTLADARDMAAANLLAIKQGKDPLMEKHLVAEENRRAAAPTFADAARQVIELRRPTWSNRKHASQRASTLDTYAYPLIGSKQVRQITSGDVLSVLTPIWTEKPETARRLRQRIETVFDWAVAQGWRSDNPAGRAVTGGRSSAANWLSCSPEGAGPPGLTQPPTLPPHICGPYLSTAPLPTLSAAGYSPSATAGSLQ